jgi:hypothetical protein
MKNTSRLILSLIMMGFSLIAMPTYIHADPDSNYGVPYSGNDKHDSYYGEKDSYHNDPNKFLDIKNAKIGVHDDIIKKIFFETRGEIPEDGSEGSFGYGVVTLVDSTFTVIATTSHEGLYDSELQLAEGNIYSPVFHNHYVELTASDKCEDAVGPAAPGLPGLEIAELTFESPGEVNIIDNKAILTNLPESANTLLVHPNGDITPGSDIQLVASFRLVQLNDIVDPLQDPFQGVCIADAQPAENVKIFDLFRDNFNNHHYNNDPYY